MRAIPLQLTHEDPQPAASVEIDAALVARSLGLETGVFRQLMQDRKISVLCERGVGEDGGLYRATFYYGYSRFRAVVEGNGRVLRTELPPAAGGSAVPQGDDA